MELEFDKEIDALVRGRGVSVGDLPPTSHLDADEIAAFAENASPERTRTLHMVHMADCDRCRKILSNLIALNAEAEPEKATAPIPASVPEAVAVPWYRKLFLFPNLAYVMGGLVLVMGGLIGLSVFQGSLGGDAAVTTSQVTENEPPRGPMAPTEPQFSANASNAAVEMSNTTASNANTASAISDTSTNTAATTNKVNRPNGEVAAAQPAPSTSDLAMAPADPAAAKPAQPVAAPPPAMAEAAPRKDLDLAAKEDDAKARTIQENEKKKVASRTAKNEEMSVDGLETQNRARTQAGGLAKATPGPTRDMQQTFPNRADNTYELKSRRVSGKDFQFRSGAWYDTAYRGQGTTNIRRGSDEYRKLDSGLRSIAESLDGVVVTVWGGKAYRIQ